MLKISKSVLGKYVPLARVAGVDFAVAEGLSDVGLKAGLYWPAPAKSSHQLTPDFGVVHRELRRARATLIQKLSQLSAPLSAGTGAAGAGRAAGLLAFDRTGLV